MLPEVTEAHSCHDHKKTDWLFAISLGLLLFALAVYFSGLGVKLGPLGRFSEAVFELASRMWWGIALGVCFVGILSKVPREFVMSVLGSAKGIKGILRATLAGLLLDLCNHGILMVGMKLYQKGASLGQTMAFLIASPWNSFSLTVVLISLIGIKWTFVFITLSAVIAVISGLVFEYLVRLGILPENPNSFEVDRRFRFFERARVGLREQKFDLEFFKSVARHGFHESRMILRWVFFGMVLGAGVKTFVATEHLHHYFGPTIAGLGLTLVAATLIEVCSEGSSPIAADLVTRARAPGNGFAFMMTGAATDYTEILVLRETTRSWKIALFLPLVTTPQVIALGWVLNQWK